VELATDDRKPSDPSWAGKTVAFSGQGATTIYGVPLDRQAQLMLARWAGCEVLPRLTKKTDALIVADSSEPTTNLQKARDYGVAIVQEPNFVAAVGVPPEIIGRVSERWARI
jgi:NAD-dependent DNA ligase